MQVKTLSPLMLVENSTQLAHKVEKSGYMPEVIIGIKTGGVYVAKPMFDVMKDKNNSLLYAEISLSRSTSVKKKKFRVSKILKRLPYVITNTLRRLEVKIFEMSSKHEYSDSRELHVKMDSSLKEILAHTNKILLVDDAIDTGSTLLAIKNVIRKEFSNVSIKTAVLTSTHKKSYVTCDYQLYESVLLRCPWAADYRGV